MNVFISEMCKTMGIADAQNLNCCCAQGTIIDDTKVSFHLTLPGGIKIEVYTPTADSAATDQGFAYIPEYDQESPDMCAEDLGAWADDCLDCARRIDAYYDSIKGRRTNLNSALDPDLATRVKDVFRAAQAAVDLPPGFRYTAFRENKAANLILSTLMYTSPKVGTQWVAKSSLGIDPIDPDTAGSDEWNFEPNYNPDSEGHLIYHRTGRFIDVEQGMYGYTAEGENADKRDRRAAYWLAGLLSDMVDSMLENPPARCYEFFLADGIAELKKSDLDRMSVPGVMRLVTKGYVDPEKVLRAKPTLANDLVKKGLITPEIVARRVPERILWLVQQGYISPDYAVKVDPSIKDKLIKRGLYQVAEGIPDNADEILAGVQAGSISPTDAYRKNPKLLQPMVEQKLITPQEAYKLDASIVTWLLLNHFIGRDEATKVKPDIQKYIAKKYKDVNWDDLDASLSEEDEDDGEWMYVASKEIYDWDGFTTEYSWYRNEDGLNVFVYGDSDMYRPEDTEWDFETESDEEAREWFDSYTGAGEGEDFDSSKQSVSLKCNRRRQIVRKNKKKTRKPNKLNSSIGFNSALTEETLQEGEPVAALGPSATPDGYQMLAETTAEGPGYVAEVMLPEDNFDGVIIPGDSEEMCKETLTQMLLANDGTFIDWKQIPCIQTFKSENPNGNFVVLN